MGRTLDSPEQRKYFSVGDRHEFDPEKWMPNGNDAETDLLPKREPETHVKVLIVGAGFAGLMAALECWRKGHTVVGILDRNQGPNFSGDLIIIQPSALEALRFWRQMCRELEEDKVTAGTYYYRHDGELIDGPAQPSYNAPEHVAERKRRLGEFPYCGAVQIRKKFYRMLLRQVARLGLTVDYGQRVDSYLEDDTAGLAGVVLTDSSVRTAHVGKLSVKLRNFISTVLTNFFYSVVAADGFRSQSELLIAGEHAPTRSSGMSVYRTAFPAELAFADDMVRQRWEGKHTYEFWMGSGMHIGLYLSPEVVAFGITPRDEFLDPNKVAKESWTPAVDPDEVIEVMRRARLPGPGSGSDWHPVIEALVRTAPNCIHWPLRWRNLSRDWVSKAGRVVQIGDAAHSTVPSSAAGGTLALEDAITLAACLQLSAMPGSAAGPSSGAGVPFGTRVYNLLRYERASCTQKMAFVNAQVLGHTIDWDDLRKNPEKARVRYPKWLFRHDPEAYVYENYGRAFAHVVSGSEFRNTNIPPGHNFVHWTIEEIHKQMADGKRVEDLLDGDWT